MSPVVVVSELIALPCRAAPLGFRCSVRNANGTERLLPADLLAASSRVLLVRVGVSWFSSGMGCLCEFSSFGSLLSVSLVPIEVSGVLPRRKFVLNCLKLSQIVSDCRLFSLIVFTVGRMRSLHCLIFWNCFR